MRGHYAKHYQVSDISAREISLEAPVRGIQPDKGLPTIFIRYRQPLDAQKDSAASQAHSKSVQPVVGQTFLPSRINVLRD